MFAGALITLLSQPMHAADFYWDADLNATGNATSGTGLGSIANVRPNTNNIWNFTDAIWWDGVSASDAAVSAATFSTAGNVAIFNGTGGVVNLSAATTVDTLRVDSPGYIFQMDNSNTSATGNGTAGYSITTNALTGTGTATFQTNFAGRLTLNSAVDQTASFNLGSGAGNQMNMVKTGAGTLTWNGAFGALRHNNATDTTVQVQGGTLRLGTAWTGSGTFSGISLTNASTIDFNGRTTSFGRGIFGAATTTVTNSNATLSTVTLGASQGFSSTTDALITGKLALVYSPNSVAGNVLTLTNSNNTYDGGISVT